MWNVERSSFSCPGSPQQNPALRDREEKGGLLVTCHSERSPVCLLKPQFPSVQALRAETPFWARPVVKVLTEAMWRLAGVGVAYVARKPLGKVRMFFILLPHPHPRNFAISVLKRGSLFKA